MPNSAMTRSVLMPDHVDTDWQSQAMCRGIITDGTIPGDHDEVIFPVTKSGPDLTVDFRTIMCGACPVRDACLAFALEMGYTGAWGGELLTEESIRKHRRNRHLRSA